MCERLGEGEAKDLASQLPMEIGRHLTQPDGGQHFSRQEFIERVAERAEIDEADANYHSQAVLALVYECVEESEMEQVRDQLPDEFDELFVFVETDVTPW